MSLQKTKLVKNYNTVSIHVMPSWKETEIDVDVGKCWITVWCGAKFELCQTDNKYYKHPSIATRQSKLSGFYVRIEYNPKYTRIVRNEAEETKNLFKELPSLFW